MVAELHRPQGVEERFPSDNGVYAEEGLPPMLASMKRMLKRRSRRPVSDYQCDEMEECTDGMYACRQIELAKQSCMEPGGAD